MSTKWRSDEDVRVIVVQNFSQYVMLDEPVRKIDSCSLMERTLDLQLWDVRKALHLLWTSNQSAMDMHFSPIVLHCEDVTLLEELQSVTMSNLSPSKAGLQLQESCYLRLQGSS